MLGTTLNQLCGLHMQSIHAFLQIVSGPICPDLHLLFLYFLLLAAPIFLTRTCLLNHSQFDRLIRSVVLYKARSSVSLHLQFCGYLHGCPHFLRVPSFRRPSPILILLPAFVALVQQTVSNVRQHVDDTTMDPITSAQRSRTALPAVSLLLTLPRDDVEPRRRTGLIQIFFTFVIRALPFDPVCVLWLFTIGN